jgi:hypothetical protein
MKCDSVDRFPDSGIRAEHGVPRLVSAVRRGLASQLVLAAFVVLPAHAMAEDPSATPAAPPPAQHPPPPPENVPPVPPAQVIEAGSVPEAPQQYEIYDRDDRDDRFDEASNVVERSAPPPTATPPKAPPVDGQWVYTEQYGWVWMPYSQSYTSVPSDGYPSMYLYGPTFGWRWVAAPWVFDYGPAPYWGNRGRVGFVWYSRPWFSRRAYVGPRYNVGARYYSAPRHYSAPRYSGGPRYRGPRYSSGGSRRVVIVREHGGGGRSHGGGGRGRR